MHVAKFAAQQAKVLVMPFMAAPFLSSIISTRATHKSSAEGDAAQPIIAHLRLAFLYNACITAMRACIMFGFFVRRMSATRQTQPDGRT